MSDPSPRSRRPRFSLLNLVLLMTIVAMGLVIARLAPLQWEVQRLRDRTGYLTIRNRSKLHVISVPSESPLVWRWRVYVPDGVQEVGLGVKVGEIPQAADSVALKAGMWGGLSIDNREHELVVRIFRNLNGNWECEYSIGGRSSRTRLTEEQVAAIRESHGWAEAGVGGRTRTQDIGDAVILLRRRFSDGSGASVNSAGPGLLFWLVCRP